MLYDKGTQSVYFRFFVIKARPAPYPLSRKSRPWISHYRLFLIHKKMKSVTAYLTGLKCGVYKIMFEREILGSGL